ncbi:hypothetical protein M758_8G141900 [Ceratodon purpureus]|nr:hypothetical protein M758_8G141900 [Ceratodon purpureus]
MFKSATSAAEPVEGVFSGSLDEADVPMRPRPAVKVPRMFESASANHTEAPKVSADIVTSVVEDWSRRTPVEENPNQSDIKVASQEEDGDTRSNLLSLFNVEQDEPQACGNEHGHGVSSSVPLPEGQNGVDDNTKWIQRATWKSLMGADGRATFSLKQLTGEAEITTKAAEVKKSDSVPKHSFSAFSFNFTHIAAPEAKRESVGIEQRAEKVPESGEKPKAAAAAAKAPEDESGCLFMKSADAEKEWRSSRSQLRMDSRAKHKAAVRKMKKMKGIRGGKIVLPDLF